MVSIEKTNWKKVLVMGGGAIGSILSAHLAVNKNFQITLLDPYAPEHLNAIKENGIVCHCGVGDKKMDERIFAGPIKINVANSISEIKEKPEIIYISTKASALENITEQLTKKFAGGVKSEIVCMQNGFGNEEYLSEKLKINALRIAINYVGKITEPGKVEGHWLQPPNFIGATYPEKPNGAKEISEIMTNSGLNTKYVEDIKFATFYKTMLNAGLLVPCTITEKTMIEAMEDKKILETIVTPVLLECLKVADAMGFRYEERQKNIETLHNYLRSGGNHRTSMRQDFEAGIPTENYWINSAIARAGKKVGIETPYNSWLAKIIDNLEKSPKKKMVSSKKNAKEILYNMTSSAH